MKDPHNTGLLDDPKCKCGEVLCDENRLMCLECLCAFCRVCAHKHYDTVHNPDHCRHTPGADRAAPKRFRRARLRIASPFKEDQEKP